MKYTRKPITVDAIKWMKNGDHPQDGTDFDEHGILLEGKVIRYFRDPNVDGETICALCGERAHVHGFLDLPNGAQIVCPGSFVVTKDDGTTIALSPKDFADNFEEVPA